VSALKTRERNPPSPGLSATLPHRMSEGVLLEREATGVYRFAAGRPPGAENDISK